MADARSITLALGGRWGRGYGLAFCPAHDNRRTPALSLRDGDDGRLLAHCFAGCTFRDIVTALDARGLQHDRQDKAPVHRDRGDERRTAVNRAVAVWAGTTPIRGTLAEQYLRGRAIVCPLPDTLRYLAHCWHPTARRLPALVAKVERAGSLVGVHRTYLDEDGTKADIDPPKAMLGACAGGYVRLSDGTGPLVVCEGIETGLSLVDQLVDLGPAVCTALSTAGIRAIDLDAFNRRDLVVAPDGDDAGRAAAEALAARAAGDGWAVRIMHPPAGIDWNDVARGVPA